MRGIRDPRWLVLALVIVGAAVTYVVLSGGQDASPEAPDAQSYIGPTLAGLQLERSGSGWARYAGPDAPEGGFLGQLPDGAHELSAEVSLERPLAQRTYYAWVKGIDYDRHVRVTLAAGDAENNITTDDRDPNGFWAGPARLDVDFPTDKLTITVVGQGTVAGPARFLLRGLYLTTESGERVLVDDQVIDFRYPRERDRSPPRSGNLVRNGGFETGVGHGWGITDGRTFSVRSAWDPTMGADGSASMKLPLDPIPYGPATAGLVSTAYSVTPNKRHTLSAWVRTDAGNVAKGSIRLVNAFGSASGIPLPVAQPRIGTGFQAGPKWQRISISADLLEYPTAAYSIVIDAETQRGKHLWIDKISLEEGDTASYVPHAPLEVGLLSQQAGNLLYEDQPQEMQLRVANGTAGNTTGLVRYEIFDYLNRRVMTGRRRVAVAARSVTSRAINVDVKRRGTFRIVLWVEGIDGSQEEVLFGVVPRPQRPGPDRTSSIGIHSHFYPFTYDAATKLGIKWDRALSPAAFFRWKDIEPERGKFLWFDDDVATARQHGVSAMGVLSTNNYWPEWADRNGLPDLDRWGEFVSQVVRRYRGDVSAWEIWNEPLRVFKPEFYARMLKRAAETVRRVDPSATVVAIGGASSPAEVKSVIDALGKQFPQWPWREYIDVLSIHMYPTGEGAEQVGSGMGDAYKSEVVDAYGKPAWNTETGAWDLGNFHTENAPSAHPGRQLQEYRTAAQFTDASQLAVERLSRNFIESLGGGLSRYFYYDMRVIASPRYYLTHPTMLEYDDTIRPKGIAYSVLAKLFDHAIGLGSVRTRERGTRAYVFRRADTALAALYSESGGAKELRLRIGSPARVVAYDVMGNALAVINGRIPYGRRPVYVTAVGVTAQELQSAIQQATVRTVADRHAPNLSIDVAPRGPVAVRDLDVRWSAADDVDTPSQAQPYAIRYSYRLSGDGSNNGWSPWSPGNTAQFEDLRPGRHLFSVRARDRAGNVSQTATRMIEVEPEK